LVVAASVCICFAIAPGVNGAKVKFGIEKLGVVCIYHYPNMLGVVCCDVPKVGAEPSLVFSCESGSPAGLMGWHCSVTHRCATCLWIGLCETNS
jgi:hypothetical protein